jgi:hypothetical protein
MIPAKSNPVPGALQLMPTPLAVTLIILMLPVPGAVEDVTRPPAFEYSQKSMALDGDAVVEPL